MTGTATARAHPALRLVLCDDAVAYPLMVAAWLRALDGLELVAVLPDLAALRARVADLAPDVVLLDVVLPDGRVDRGLVDALRTAGGPDLRVVLVSNHLPDDLEQIAAEAGVDAWCSKIDGADGLLGALQQA
ncbi:hypothetical protein [Paraconexibacter sp. AEG42_29]|uniref:hypothetical protein n=1 Tax=Paraconexibacter sp. AEG42_29 TaxID=2997339 RepID=UPI00339D5385